MTRLALGVDGTPIHHAGTDGEHAACGAPIVAGPPKPGVSLTCSACYLHTPAGWRAHLRLIARDPADPRRLTALEALEGMAS